MIKLPSKTLMRSVMLAMSSLVAACATDPLETKGSPPSVAPNAQPAADALRLDRSQVSPMYREMLAIDLPNVIQIASLKNIDVLQARQRVEVSRGQLESAAASVFPIIAPGVVLDHVQGVNTSFTGQLVGVNFTTLQPSVLVQFILNPGRVYYDVIASKKRLLATEQQERFVVMEAIRSSVVQYYDLVLAQSRISVAREAVSEAEELLRLTQLRVHAGTGLPADDLRAQADLAGRQQDLAIALNGFYQASIKLASTLYLDATVTLAPKPEEIAATRLVRENLGIDEMLTIAAQWRPDLESAKTLVAAAAADTRSTLWGGLSPQLEAGYQFSGLTSRASGQNFPLQAQQQVTAGAGWNLSATLFGEVHTAKATEQQAALEAERHLEEVRAQVVRSAQDSATNAQLIPMAKQQVEAAAEALRLAQENFGAGTALTVDVLQAEATLNEARLRYANAVTSYNQSQVNLLAALGLIDSVSLSPSGPSSTAPTTRPVADHEE
jgi:multidrug efflux system outer membrane protein